GHRRVRPRVAGRYRTGDRRRTGRGGQCRHLSTFRRSGQPTRNIRDRAEGSAGSGQRYHRGRREAQDQGRYRGRWGKGHGLSRRRRGQTSAGEQAIAAKGVVMSAEPATAAPATGRSTAVYVYGIVPADVQ